jgi:hypothetical protein
LNINFMYLFIGLFMFDIYTYSSSDHTFSCHDIEVMLSDIYGLHFIDSNNGNRVYHDLISLGSTKPIDRYSFNNYVRSHPTFLYPACQLQRRIRQSIMGEVFWELATSYRIDKCEGQYYNMKDFIDMVS